MPNDKKKNTAAVALGKKGGKARAKALTPKQRSEIARKAAQKRWHNHFVKKIFLLVFKSHMGASHYYNQVYDHPYRTLTRYPATRFYKADDEIWNIGLQEVVNELERQIFGEQYFGEI